MSDYNYLIQCNFSECSRNKSCERVLSTRDEISYRHICNDNNGFKMYIELKGSEVQEEVKDSCEAQNEGCEGICEGMEVKGV